MRCSVIDCTNPAVARGWCTKHYQRARRHGEDPTAAAPNTAIRRDASSLASPRRSRPRLRDEDTIERFWSRVDKCGPIVTGHPDLGCCWLWTDGTGYA